MGGGESGGEMSEPPYVRAGITPPDEQREQFVWIQNEVMFDGSQVIAFLWISKVLCLGITNAGKGFDRTVTPNAALASAGVTMAMWTPFMDSLDAIVKKYWPEQIGAMICSVFIQILIVLNILPYVLSAQAAREVRRFSFMGFLDIFLWAGGVGAWYAVYKQNRGVDMEARGARRAREPDPRATSHARPPPARAPPRARSRRSARARTGRAWPSRSSRSTRRRCAGAAAAPDAR